MDTLNTIFLTGILSSTAVVTYLLFGKKKKQSDLSDKFVENSENRKFITLDELSKLWGNDGKTGDDQLVKIDIQEIAPVWRESNQVLKDTPEYFFQSEKITGFFTKYIQNEPAFQESRTHVDICYQLLKKLEEEGDCSSVVNIQSAPDDIEAKWDSTTYQMLGQFTLLDHSLNVARACVKRLINEQSEHVIPDIMVAALAHDIGKLPSLRNPLYATGDHPLTSAATLAKFAGYKELPKKREIDRAIKFHHKMPEGLIGTTLKKGDQAARQMELEQATEKITDQSVEDVEEKPKPEKPADHQYHQNEVKNGNSSKTSTTDTLRPVGSQAAWSAQGDIYGYDDSSTDKPKKTNGYQRLDISSWFDAQDFIESLKPYINRLTGRRFMAFSMADGHIYFQVKVFQEIIKKQAEQAGAMEIVTSDDVEIMRRVLFTVVDHLRVEHGIIDRGLIKDQYFSGKFTIETGGIALTGNYVPCHSEAFGDISLMEKKKSGILSKFKKVKPLIEKQKEGDG